MARRKGAGLSGWVSFRQEAGLLWVLHGFVFNHWWMVEILDGEGRVAAREVVAGIMSRREAETVFAKRMAESPRAGGMPPFRTRRPSIAEKVMVLAGLPV